MTRAEDQARAEQFMRLLAPDAGETWGTVLLGEPHSKARPRFSADGGAYKDPADELAEQTTQWKLRSWWRRKPLTGNVALVCVFYRSTLRLVDTDNLIKHVCDAGNGLLWADDSQITAKLGVVELDRGSPRTVLGIGPHVSTMLRGTDKTRKPAKAVER